MKQHNKLTIPLIVSTALVGCGSDSGTGPEILDPPVALEVPDLTNLQVSLEPLENNQANKFSTVLKNGIFMRSGQYNIMTALPTAPSVPEAAQADSAAGSKFSSTITQEQGVDEADRIKYDGNILYIAANSAYDEVLNRGETKPESSTSDSPLPVDAVADYTPHIRVMQKQADDSLLALSTVSIMPDDISGNIRGLYLAPNRMAAIYETYSGFGLPVEPAASSFASTIWMPGPSKFGLSLNNTETPDAISSVQNYSIDGYVISSRRIDNQLYIVSSYSPQTPEYEGDPETAEGQKQNYNQLINTSINEFLPKITDADGNESNLVNANNCYVQQGTTDEDSYSAIVTLSSFNLTDGSLTSSVCVNAPVDNFYASTDSLYLFATRWDESSNTVIHKFNLGDSDINYKSSGFVKGQFGWSNAQFRLSEDGDFLRAVTTGHNDDGIYHQLNVLQDTGSKLEQVATLPNADQPDAIGKPGEDIYAVRYFGSKAYIVTFFRRDPLYVIDLSDNTNPTIQGELDIPGYSAYLHPLSENYIFGIGQQVDENQIQPEPTPEPAETGETGDTDSTVSTTADENPVEEGAKVELYDVSDPANPKVVETLVFTNGYTPAEWDYHALTYLHSSDTERKFAVPVESWSSYIEEGGGQVWQRNVSLKLIDINLGDSASMTLNGEVVPVVDGQHFYGGWNDRAVLHDDLIYYVHGDLVWKSLWSQPKDTLGPY